jgi:hypothetical protein
MAQVVIRSGADASGTAVGIIGPLRRELATLTGLEVRVWGEAAPNEVPRPPRAIAVDGYAVVAVGGQRAYVGVLARRGEDYWLVDDQAHRLVAAPSALQGEVGAKVWVTGTADGDSLAIESYGVIRRR